MSKKICPLFQVAGLLAGKKNQDQDGSQASQAECLRSLCAWFDADSSPAGECAIKAVSEALDRLGWKTE